MTREHDITFINGMTPDERLALADEWYAQMTLEERDGKNRDEKVEGVRKLIAALELLHSKE